MQIILSIATMQSVTLRIAIRARVDSYINIAMYLYIAMDFLTPFGGKVKEIANFIQRKHPIIFYKKQNCIQIFSNIRFTHEESSQLKFEICPFIALIDRVNHGYG